METKKLVEEMLQAFVWETKHRFFTKEDEKENVIEMFFYADNNGEIKELWNDVCYYMSQMIKRKTGEIWTYGDEKDEKDEKEIRFFFKKNG